MKTVADLRAILCTLPSGDLKLNLTVRRGDNLEALDFPISDFGFDAESDTLDFFVDEPEMTVGTAWTYWAYDSDEHESLQEALNYDRASQLFITEAEIPLAKKVIKAVNDVIKIVAFRKIETEREL